MDSIVSAVKKVFGKNRRCIVCEERMAEFCVKGVKNTCYCKECAQEQFGDLGLLEEL